MPRKPLTVATDKPDKPISFTLDADEFADLRSGLRISRDGVAQTEAKRGPPADPIPSAAPVATLDDLQMLELIGHGSGGVVHKAQQISTGRLLAVKSINVLDTGKRRQLMVELKTLQRASSPYIVSFFGAFYDDSHLYIALEHMDAGALQDVLRKARTIPEDVIVSFGQQIVAGMLYMHQVMHQVHRDIKPGNILINRKGRVKLTDFGVTGTLEDTLAQCATFVGTAKYMAPEQLAGQPYSYAADVWAFGVCLVECATGIHPFAEWKCSTPMELHLAVQSNPIPTLSSRTFSPEFCDFASRCLCKAGTDRAPVVDLYHHKFLAREAAEREAVEWLEEVLGAGGKSGAGSAGGPWRSPLVSPVQQPRATMTGPVPPPAGPSSGVAGSSGGGHPAMRRPVGSPVGAPPGTPPDGHARPGGYRARIAAAKRAEAASGGGNSIAVSPSTVVGDMTPQDKERERIRVERELVKLQKQLHDLESNDVGT